MTPERLRELFSNDDDEFMKFERVVNPRHPCPGICAFLILHDLVPPSYPTEDMVAGARHDEIFLRPDIESLAAAATDEDVLMLRRCGVHLDTDDECLAMFV